ncbi:hypothetical protein [Microbacterium hatanonis]|uniref:Uncharacterized protein n=1 Tax=Microbacterium hatanonis TaxID=404366 RepID=A0A5C8I200_9MICO|nr:hypothetical protein [Microbacterium hatanonis]TXK12359.1 hypothetical protein FVP77_02450 [Microbacterium hatanonis]
MSCGIVDELCRSLDEIVNALNDPWDGFLGVLLATLIGAVIGAGAAYVFSLMLRAQQRRDAADDFARHEASQKALEDARAARERQADRDRLSAAQDVETSRRNWEAIREESRREEAREALFVASLIPIVQRLHEFASNLQANYAAAQRDRRDVMGLIRLARIYSTAEQREVLRAAFSYVDDENRIPRGLLGSKSAERVADLLVAWREGSMTAAQVVSELGADYTGSRA